MSDKTSHLEEAILLWEGFLRFDYDCYKEHFKVLLKSEYGFCKTANIDFDILINCAIENRHYNYINDTPPPYFPFIYNHNKSIHENLKDWGDKIQQFAKTENENNKTDISNIQETTARKLWNKLINDETFVKNNKNLFFAYNNTQAEVFYLHIIKSLLNAEYLFLEDYSKKLKNAVEGLVNDAQDESNQPVIRNKYIEYIKRPYFIRDFLIIAQQLRDLCWRIKNAIGDNNKRRIELYDSLEEFAERTIRNIRLEDQLEKTENDIKYFHLTQSVIDMTAIDHIYKASSNNIGKMITLWQRTIKVDENVSIRILKAKTAAMLQKMLFDIGDKESRKLLKFDKVDFFYSMGGVNEEELKKEIEEACVIIPKEDEKLEKDKKLEKILNPIIRTKEEKKNQRVTENDFEEQPSETIPTDIRKYNNWIKKGQDNYIKLSNLIEKIHKIQDRMGVTTDEIQDTVNVINSFISDSNNNNEHYSPYFFLLVLDFLKCNIENQKDTQLYIKLMNLLTKVLYTLKDYLITYEKRMPLVFRPFFQHCFYEFNVSDNKFTYCENINVNYYDYKDYNNRFFFASYYCNPISINRLQETYEEYTMLFNIYSSNLAIEIKTMEAQIDANIKKQEEDIKNTQRTSLQTLGLFTGFLAFIVTSIGTFRVAGNITEYIIYSLTYTLAIILFAFLISKHDAKQYTKESMPNINGFLRFTFNWGKYIVYIVSLGALIWFAWYYYTSKNFSKPKEEISITIDNSSTSIKQSLQDINQNDSTMEDSPIKPDNGENSNDNNHTSIDNASQE